MAFPSNANYPTESKVIVEVEQELQTGSIDTFVEQ
jgi:hypothetical protein